MKNRVAFTMRLHAGKEKEYKERHDAIWPDLVALLGASGISNYSIFLDEHTNLLFGVLDCDNMEAMEKLPSAPVMQKWWAYMKDIMFSNADNSPVSTPLKELFFLP